MIELIIDHAALAHNIGVVRSMGDAPVLAVMKAHGFNHGIREVAATAKAAGVEWLGVATVDEALELRDAGIDDMPVLAWLVDPWSRIRDALDADITLSAPNLETLDAIAALAAQQGRTPDVHLQLDTGMARGGVDQRDWSHVFEVARDHETHGRLHIAAIWSHLAKAADPSESAVSAQVDLLQRGIDLAVAHGLNPELSHLANSAGSLAHPSTHRSLVRAGAALYGIQPVRGEYYPLRATVRMLSRVTQLHRVAAGTGVGYDHAFVTDRDTTLAVVPAGYADGVARSLSGRADVVIRQTRHPIVGIVSMDQIVVDVGDDPVALGDEVVLLGDPRRGEPDLAEWAEITQTVPQEVLTGFGTRVARIHINQSGPSGTSGPADGNNEGGTQ